MKLDNSVKITGIVAVAVLLLALIVVNVVSNTNPYQSDTVTAQGMAEIKVMPDLAIVSFNIQTKDKSAVDAKNNNSEIVESVITQLVMLGLDRDMISTESFNVYPEYDWSNNQQRVKGYVASHILKVELSTEDFDDVGEVIDAGVDAGALVNYMSFELSQDLQNEFKAKALEAATADARNKAESIARGLGTKVKGVVSVSTSDFDYNPWMLYEGRAMDSSASSQEIAVAAKEAVTDISPGQREVTARVSVVFKLS